MQHSNRPEYLKVYQPLVMGAFNINGLGDNHLSIKEGSLFCSYGIHQTGMLHILFLVSLESSGQGGVHGLGSMMFGLRVKSS
jgi:hypothetical protein